MDLELTSEQELIRASAREFAEREIAPHARDWDRAEEIDRALVPKLADAGYLGAGWDEEYGGSGLDDLVVRARRRGAGQGGLLGARDRLRQRRARRQDDRALRHGGAEARVAPEARLRRGARLLRAHGAGLRL